MLSIPPPTLSFRSSTALILPHGINFSPDGARVYVSNESESVLEAVDQKSGEILKKVPLSGRPNNISITQRRPSVSS